MSQRLQMRRAHAQYTPKEIHKALKKVIRKESVSVTIRGDCMMPLINANSRLQVTPSRYYWPGDVIVFFSNNGHYLAHRVIGIYWQSRRVKWMTQGDSARSPDAGVEAEAILGKVSGGDCHTHAVAIPFSSRLTALYYFAKALVFGLNRRFLSYRGP